MGGRSNHFKRHNCAGNEVPLKEDSFFFFFFFLSDPPDTKSIGLSSAIDYYSLQKTGKCIPFALRQRVNTRLRFSFRSGGEIAQSVWFKMKVYDLCISEAFADHAILQAILGSLVLIFFSVHFCFVKSFSSFLLFLYKQCLLPLEGITL